MRRRRLPLLPNVTAYFASPEDVILYKLLYYRQIESGPHLRDVLGILRVSGPELDESDIREWADRLGLRPLWDQVRKQVECDCSARRLLMTQAHRSLTADRGVCTHCISGEEKSCASEDSEVG